MQFPAKNIIQQKENSLWGSQLNLLWIKWAVSFFLIASIFGLMLRYFFIGGVNVLAYKNVLHAHSHVALLGWGFLLVSGGIIFTFIKDFKETKIYHRILVILVLATLGMSISFPLQGYGIYSITFSTLHLLGTYVLAYHLLQDLKKSSSKWGKKFIKFSILWLLIASLGLWAIGPISTVLGKSHPLYFLSVQWYLHFQMNGWFIYAVFGLFIHALEQRGWHGKNLNISLFILHLSLILTLAFPISWSYQLSGLLLANGFGVILQVFAYALILLPFYHQLKKYQKTNEDWSIKILQVSLISLAVKAIFQLFLIFPDIASITYTIRMFVISFIHLILLGVVTFGIGFYYLQNNGLPKDIMSKWGWMLLIASFVIMETLLLGQGTLIWFKLGFIPYYYNLIFIASLIFPIALLLILIPLFKKKVLDPNNKIEKLKKPISLNYQTMKSSFIMLFVALMLLITSCGGGDSEQGTNSSTILSENNKVADPKGIGEIREVDLGEKIDEDLSKKGKAIVEMKCTACHQLNDKRVVGPGFQDITNRRRPEWIMNMITNVDVMLERDPVAQALLEECLTRMPNQNISPTDAREILEFLRKNDLEKTGSKDAALK